MLLQRLVEYADRLDPLPTLYVTAPVRYVVELDGSGRLLSPEPTDTSDPQNRRAQRGLARPVPQVQRSSGVRPLLLADNAEYTFGLGRDSSKPDRVAACRAAYVEILGRCADATRDPAVAAVLAFLSADPVAQLELPETFDRGATITFRVDGAYVVDRPAVREFWAAEHDPGRASAGSPTRMQCLVCGREQPVLNRLQGKLKGVPGGQTAGTSIISANAEAFESYGLQASLIAPTCASCGERFTKAANALLSSDTNRIVLGGSAFLFWTRQQVAFSFRDLLANPQPEQVHELLATVRTGRPMPDVDDTAFYAMVLSGSGGRAVVRDWIDTTVGEVKAHLGTWFRQQRIVGDWGDEPRPLGLFALAGATVRELKDLAPPVPRVLLRSALVGTPLPPDLLYQAVRRSRAEQRVTRSQAALIKLVWCSRHPTDREDYMVQLELDNPNPAYRCGRLLAVLESVQRLALPGAKATIVDRFFGTASSAPASVFARLVRGAQPHLAKLERDRRPAHRALQRRIGEILAPLPTFPRTLTLEEQGLFALGYYHQRALDRAQTRQAVARRAAAAADAPDAADAPSDDQSLAVALVAEDRKEN